MDNRGYRYSSRQSQRPVPPPPVYTVEAGVERESRRPIEYERPVEYEHHRMSRKRQYSTSSESSVEHEKIIVEDPPDGGRWAWFVVLACAVLHLCNELTYFLFFNTIVIGQFRNQRLAAEGVAPVDTYTDFQVFEDVRLGGEFIAAIASIFIGYRAVGIFGGVLVLAGFLGASFVDPGDNWELMGFLVGFLGGLGCSFWRFTAYVAILEYFKKHRMTALVLSGLGRAIGIFIGYGILAPVFKKLRETDTTLEDLKDMTDWDVYYQCISAPAVVAAFAAAVIATPSLIKDRSRHMDCTKLFKLLDLSFCRGGFLLLTLIIYFIYYLGASLPSTSMIYWMVEQDFSTKHILAAIFTLASGVTLGYVLLGFWPIKKKMHSSLIWMGVMAMILGLVTLQLPVFTSNYSSYVIAYMAILGVTQVLFETILRWVIPIAFSRQYIRWVEGLLGLMAGGATIVNNFVAEELFEEDGGLDNVFYFAGSAFLAAGLIAIITVNLLACFKFKDKNLEREPPFLAVDKAPRESRREVEEAPRYFRGHRYR